MDNLHFILYHFYEPLHTELARIFEQKIAPLEIPHTFYAVGEEYLANGSIAPETALPQGAVALVHGNAREGYKNVREVVRLASARQDLRFIISVDPNLLHEAIFTNKRDYDVIRMYLERDSSARELITVTQKDVLEFMNGGKESRTQGTEPLLVQYLRQWKQLQGEQ